MFDLVVARAIGERYLERLRPNCHTIEIAGSIRRGRPMVKDIEIVCIPKTNLVSIGLFDDEEERRTPLFAEALMEDVRILKGNLDTGKYIQLELPEGIKMDLFIATVDNWGFIYMIRTGSAEFSQYLGKRWVKWGYKGIRGRLTRDEEIIPTPTEEGVFDLLGLPWVPPEQRNQMGLPG